MAGVSNYNVSLGFGSRCGNDQLKCADRRVSEVLRLLIIDLAVVQVRDVGVIGLGVFERGKEQGDQRQHADPAGAAASTNFSKRRFNAEVSSLGHLARDEGEGAVADIEQGVRRSASR